MDNVTSKIRTWSRSSAHHIRPLGEDSTACDRNPFPNVTGYDHLVRNSDEKCHRLFRWESELPFFIVSIDGENPVAYLPTDGLHGTQAAPDFHVCSLFKSWGKAFGKQRGG